MSERSSKPLLAEPIAPWSPQARRLLQSGEAAVEMMATSAARDDLANEIRRYLRDEQSGRSYLLAGHRGAGKTTTVLGAMQQVYNECLRKEDPRLLRCRPILVRLHAPSLLLPRLDREKAKDGSPLPVPEAPSYPERFLQEMAAGIFPALLEEVRAELVYLISRQRDRRPDALEMAAHVFDELSRGMPLGELRAMFRHLGVPETGLLGKSNLFDELVAIQAAGEAYMVVTGTLETEDKSGADMSAKEQREFRIGFDGGKAAQALTPLAASVAGALGLAAHQPGAAIAVTLSILLGGLVIGNKLDSERNRTAARQRSFKRDNSQQSLLRRMPLLVGQLCEVGFSPIFVLDELDKLPRPANQELLPRLMTNLKSYVTERAFACFVVDREYFESLAGSGPDPLPRYRPEHTFFSNTAYVVGSAPALHGFVRTMLGEDDLMRLGTDVVQGAQDRALAVDISLLRHVVLHRARLHAYDVRRELEGMQANGMLALVRSSAGAFAPPRLWRYQAFLQLCIEWVMSDTEVRRRGVEDRFFPQLLHDALYAVSESWRKAGAEMDTPEVQPDSTLRRAVSELLALLQLPATNLKDVVETWFEIERLEFYLLQGERPPVEGGGKSTVERLIRDKKQTEVHRERLDKCFASPKYSLLHEVCDALLPTMLSRAAPVPPPGEPLWLVNPEGYLPTDQEQPAETQKLDELMARRREFPDAEFAALWSLAAPSAPLSQLDVARRNSKPDDPEQRDVTRRFARLVDHAIETVQWLKLSALLLRTAQPTLDFLQAINELSRGMEGEDPISRRHASRRLFAFLFTGEVGKEEQLGEFLPGKALDEVPTLQAWPGPHPGVKFADLRSAWEDSLKSRIVAQLTSSPPSVAAPPDGNYLDILGSVLGWFPAGLRRWLSEPLPASWPVVQYVDLLSEALAAPDHAWFGVVAAAQLNQKHLLTSGPLAQEFGALLKTPTPGAHALGEWAKARLDAMNDGQIACLLVKPGPILRAWACSPKFAIWSVDTDPRAEKFAQFTPYDYVFSETDAPLPSGFEPGQFVIVLPREERGSPFEIRETDRAIVLHGPTSVDEAIDRLAAALGRLAD
jgi:hypothetical protein